MKRTRSSARWPRAEIAELEPHLEQLEEQIKLLLIPKDPQDDKNAILEIRGGTGGDEAAIFAGDLLRMYTRFIENRGWKYEINSESEGAAADYKEVVLKVTGTGVYGVLKYESGVHRVQRVPQTETQGQRAYVGSFGGCASRGRGVRDRA